MKFKPYPKYKPSGVEWLGSVPDTWNVSRLKWSVEETKGGVWGDEPVGDTNDLVCIRVADFNRDQLKVEINNLTTRNISISERNGRCLKIGDLLLEKSGGGENQPVGCVIEFDQKFPAVCSNFINRLVPSKYGYSGYFKFVHNTLYAIRLTTRSINQTSGIQNLDTDRYLSESVGYPSIEEQSAIACFLDRETAKIDTLIAKQEKLIELLKEKRQAVISHAVTKGLDSTVQMKPSGVEWLGEVPEHWTICRLKHVANVKGGFAFESSAFTPEGIQLIRIGNLYQNELRLDREPVFLNEDTERDFQDFSVEAGDLLMSLTGTLGKRDYGFAVLLAGKGKYLLNQRVAKLEANADKITPELLLRILHSDAYLSQIYSLPFGTKQANLSNGDVVGAYIAYPPSAREQQELANYIGQKIQYFDEAIRLSNKSINLQKEHRTALISAAVTGKIDVRSGLEVRKAA